ncbi:NUDIX domain-containing protein [Patescibacteria group bacterium]
MDKDQIHKEWVKHPVGKIGKGGFCDECKRFNVRNTTTQMIPVRDGKILLQKRNLNPEKGSWALVAGYLGWDETLEECMERELKEELGLKLNHLSLFGIYSDPKRDKDGRQNVAVVYVGEVEGKIKIDPYEVEEAGWFDLDDLPEKIAFDHRKMIEEYKETLFSHGCCGGGCGGHC